jgi:predicted ATPase
VDPHLLGLVLDRLSADDELNEAAADLVLAACEGPIALEQAISGRSPERPQPLLPDGLIAEPAGAYLRSVSVQGFRGIGPPAELELSPGPGLTLIVGRNGSGKSSFAEGFELLLTGANLRWEARTKVWREGWQNLHHAGPTTLSAELYVDGEPGLLRVTRKWPPDSDVTAANQCVVTRGDGTRTTLSELGWDLALSRYRPFLSYAELGAMFDELATMYDALAAILGLGDVDALADSLRAARLDRERAFREFKARRDGFLVRLDTCADERAEAAARALWEKPPDFDALEFALEGLVEGADPTGELESLRGLARLAPPADDRVADAISGLEASTIRLDALVATDAARDAGVADLLEAALRHRADHDDPDCPVCGTANVLDAAWHARATEEVRERRVRACGYDAARDQAASAQRSLESLAGTLDAGAAAQVASKLGIDPGSVVDRWVGWQEAVRNANGHDIASLRRAHLKMAAAVTALAELARAEVERRDDAWRPIAADMRVYLPVAVAAVAGQQQLPNLKSAEKWVREASATFQAQRLAPIAEAAKANWDELRQESNVSLDGFHLQRSGNARRAEVAVSVDGSEASAFGVMSQGELHSLAVSVFLPRAGFRESPFRFMVIDDPVQSMDPAKVDGLARVLAAAGTDRQVIVFTHDERLPEAARRLGLDTTVLEVTRRAESVVEVRVALDPVERYIDDARALVRSEDVPDQVVARVVPGFCRHALEAACTQAIRRRRLAVGSPHAAVEDALRRSTTLTTMLALALFDDETKGSQVLTAINNRFGRRGGDAVKLANKGAHEVLLGDLRDLVSSAAILARKLAELP